MRAANQNLGKSDWEASGVLSAAQRHTHFLDSPRIVDATSASDFVFADLKEKSGTVFLCLPPDRLDTYSRQPGKGELWGTPSPFVVYDC